MTRLACRLPFLLAAVPLALLLSTALLAPVLAAETAWTDKVAPIVLERATRGETEFIVVLAEQADLAAAASLPTKEAKGRYVFERLTEVAARTQPAVVAALEAEAAEVQRFWVANCIRVRGGWRALERMASRDDVAHVQANPAGRFPLDVEPRPAESDASKRRSASAIEWNLTRVEAPSVWAQGVRGEGAVVGILDTGNEWDHPATINQYRGWNGLAADHDYNWHDAIHVPVQGNCPPDSPEPCDDHGHGTHVTGTAVGDDGGPNQIGMAPEAKWISCRLWEPIERSELSYCLECLQWMLAPTDLNDQNPQPALAPDVISNSWICEPDEGCADPNVLLPAVQNVRAAGVVVVAGAGNDGDGCGSVMFPPAIYEPTFAVGATQMAGDTITSFSSRGPVTIDGSGRLKPDIAAPGLDIRSSFPGQTYFVWQGTSMATPHVAGLVALLVSANPALAGDVDAIEEIIRNSAVPKTSAQQCGGVPGSQVPNNTFGHGRIDAFAAYQQAVALATSVSEAAGPAGEASAPRAARLSPNVPNPFNPATIIWYELGERTDVSLRVYDASGRVVRTLVERPAQEAGRHSATWDGRDDEGRPAPSGIYFYRLRAGGFDDTRRMTLLK